MKPAPTLPGYRVLAELGSGASGTVYRALQIELGREVAIKVLAPGLFEADETRARFVRESKLQAKLSDPNLVEIFDAGLCDDGAYLVMELVAGGSLRDLLDQLGRLPPARGIRIAHGVATGLAHAHALGIIHRDLKPENVMLAADELVKIGDFGLAKTLSAHQTFQTHTGVIVGTPGYIAPEAIEGLPATAAADVYALGVIVFESIAGRRPFSGEVSQILQAQLTQEAPPLSQLAAGLPAGLEELTARCLERYPEDRPSTAAQVAESLGTMLSGRVPPAMVPRRRRSTRSPSAHTVVTRPQQPAVKTASISSPAPRRPGVLTAGIAFALAAACAGLFLLRGQTARPTAENRPPPPPTARPALPPPQLRAVSVGHDRAVLRLSGAAPAGMVVSVELAKGTTRSVHVTEGSTEVRIPDLPAETKLQGRMETAGGFRMFSIRTHPTVGKLDCTKLDPNGSHPSELTLAARGERLLVVWTRGTEYLKRCIACSESRDGGASWDPLSESCRPGFVFSHPTAAVSEVGPVMGWGEIAPGEGGRYRSRLRDLRDERWEAQISIPGAFWPGPVLLPGAAGTVTMLLPAQEQSRELRPVIQYAECAPARVQSSPWTPVLSLPANMDRLMLARCGSRLVAVAVPERNEGTESLRAAFLSPPIGRSREPWFDAGAVGIWPGQASLCASNDRALLAYQLDFRITLAILDPGAGRIGRQVSPMESARLPARPCKSPSLTYQDGKFYLAFVTMSNSPLGGVSTTQELVMLRSADGVEWQLHRRIRLDLSGETKWTELVACPRNFVVAMLSDNEGLLVFRPPLK